MLLLLEDVYAWGFEKTVRIYTQRYHRGCFPPSPQNKKKEMSQQRRKKKVQVRILLSIVMIQWVEAILIIKGWGRNAPFSSLLKIVVFVINMDDTAKKKA